jgi:hypothetical protein
MRRALREAAAVPADKPEFADKEIVAIRMVLVNGLDEYAKPKWGSASEVASFEVDRASVRALKAEDVNGLAGDALRQPFRSVKVAHGNIK